ncbi:hypothetical protein AGMMS49983_05880 [Clostridia bacterium]|nr:hypothetical protein AGMMS49983_05880 [Clostridia bacterium]
MEKKDIQDIQNRIDSILDYFCEYEAIAGLMQSDLEKYDDKWPNPK